MGDELVQLDYATPPQLVLSEKLGRIAGACIMLSVAAFIVAVVFNQGLAGMSAYGLGLCGFVVSSVAIFRRVSRTSTALVAFWISFFYLLVLILLAV
jgi:hypothetical protein